MKNCFLYQDDLKAYGDGELSPLRRWAVRRHLTHCASCREEIEAMTQLTENLRATEPEDTLSPTLREKLLAEPTPLQAATLSKREGEELEPLSPPVSGGPLRSNLLRSKEVGSKRRLPAWTFAALAVVAWFVCYPLFQKARQQTQTASAPAPTASRNMKVFKPYPVIPKERPIPPRRMAEIPEPVAVSAPAALPTPKVPPTIRVHLSNREAGTDKAGGRVVYGNFGAAPLAVAGGGTSSNGNGNTVNGDPDSLRQVHKEAGIGLQVANPDATGDKINDMVKETGGYVAANNLTTDTEGLKSGELIVKVPEAQFETFLAAVAKLGMVVSKNITGQDITEQTSDAHEAQGVEESDLEQAEARLKALGSHAKWEDKEDTQDQRVKLAETRARLKLLKRMAALGTITIDLSETPKAAAAVPATTGFTGVLHSTTHDALQSLAGSAAALLALVIWLLAYSPIWVPLLLLGRYALKEYKKRKAV